MFAACDLLVLSTWCSNRGLHWVPSTSGQPSGQSSGHSSDQSSMLLEQRSASRPWQRMVLSRERGALRLMDETGVLLAEASTLPALLDAVDGGVAEPCRRSVVSGARMVAAACAGLTLQIVM